MLQSINIISWCCTIWPDFSISYLRTITQVSSHYIFFFKASARKLKPTPPRPRSLHERILEEIKAERKLRPVSPEEIRRSRLGESSAYRTPGLIILLRKCLFTTSPVKNNSLMVQSKAGLLSYLSFLSHSHAHTHTHPHIYFKCILESHRIANCFPIWSWTIPEHHGIMEGALPVSRLYFLWGFLYLSEHYFLCQGDKNPVCLHYGFFIRIKWDCGYNSL